MTDARYSDVQGSPRLPSDYHFDRPQSSSGTHSQPGRSAAQRQPAVPSALPPYSTIRDDSEGNSSVGRSSISSLRLSQMSGMSTIRRFPPSPSVYSQTSSTSLAQRPQHLHSSFPPSSAPSPVARTPSSTQIHIPRGSGASSPVTAMNIDRNGPPPGTAPSFGHYGQLSSRDRGLPLPGHLSEHSPPSSAISHDRRMSGASLKKEVPRPITAHKYEKANEHAKATLRPAMEELHRFTQVLQDRLTEELIKINDQHAARLSNVYPDYNKVVARSDQFFKLGRYWRAKCNETETRLSSLQKLFNDERVRCRRLLEDKLMLESRIASLSEEFHDRLDGDIDHQQMHRRVENEVTRRTNDLAEQLNEERAARYVAEQRIKELEESLINSDADMGQQMLSEDQDDMQPSSSHLTSSLQKSYKRNVNYSAGLVSGRQSIEIDAEEAEDVLDAADAPVAHELKLRKSDVEVSEGYRRSAPPNMDLSSHRMRGDLSARSTSYAGSTGRTFAPPELQTSDMSLKRRRSDSEDRHITNTKRRSTVIDENPGEYEFNSEGKALSQDAESNHVENDEGDLDESRLSPREKQSSMQHSS